MFIQQTIPPPSLSNQILDEDNESLTDVSMLIRTKPSLINYSQPSEYYDTSTMHETHDQFIPDDELFHSLVAYADSFNLDGSIYSVDDIKSQLNSSNSTRKRTSSSTSHVTLLSENETLIQHNKSCNDSKSTTLVEQDFSELIPSHFFSDRKIEENDKQHSDASTTITDRSKFDWEYVSDAKDNSNKSSKELFNYDATTNIEQLNLHYLNDLERFSTKGFSQSPVINQKKKKDQSIQLLNPPVPIIIREILNKPFSHIHSGRKYHLTPSPPPTHFIEHRRSHRPNINEKRGAARRKQAKQIIIEYDQVNVTVDRNIKQRKEIIRVNPNQYIKQYGSTLYSNEAFQNLVSNIIS